MFLQRRPKSKFLTADFALVRHPPSVERPVLGEIAGRRESFGTIFTSVGLLPCVSSGVSLQYFTAGESFVTQRALELVLGEM